MGIQKGLGVQSYMREGFLIYEEMREIVVTCEEAVGHMTLRPTPLKFPFE
jgi:hypothetical protein